jgi:hypothetical protein
MIYSCCRKGGLDVVGHVARMRETKNANEIVFRGKT